MEPIKNYDSYTTCMRNGFYDKLFFVDKLFDNWDSLLDYGCADGFTTTAISEIFPDKQIYGYDNDPQMIEQNKKTQTIHNDRLHFSCDLEKLLKERGDKKIDVLYLSSIIHEVYSYQTIEEVEKFWKFVFEYGFKYIVIRDMIFEGYIAMDYANEVNWEFCNSVLEKVSRKGNMDKIKEFEKHFGSIFKYKNAIHFLLKYPYINSPNWKREVSENYLPLNIEALKNRMAIQGNGKYKINYEDSRTLTFLKDYWEKELQLTVDIKLHSKFILQLKK